MGASIFKMMDGGRQRCIETLRDYVPDAELFKDHAGAARDGMTRSVLWQNTNERVGANESKDRPMPPRNILSLETAVEIVSGVAGTA
jgi:hypothetical protein